VKIRIESRATTDTCWRSHGKAVDQPLDDYWWKSQPEKEIGVAGDSFTHEQELDLKRGLHTIEYATSGSVPDYAWHAKIYVNGKLMGEGDVGKHTHLKVRFWLGLILILRVPYLLRR